MADIIPLSHLAAGVRGEIDQLVGQPHEIHRLQELGLHAGAKVEVVRGGSPCIIRLAAAKLCFRPSEAMGVLVRIDGVSLRGAS